MADYLNKLRAANRLPRYVRGLETIIDGIAKFGKLHVIADINADVVNQYVGSLRDKGRAAATISFHLTAIKGFTKWLVENHKLPRDPLSSIQKPNPKAGQRRERRALSHDEWELLKKTVANSKDSFGMTGTERALLYEVAIQTGLRSNEIRSLTRGNLFLDGEQPYITCKARSTKNKKHAQQFIQPELAVTLRAHIATKMPKAAVFDMPHNTDLARMLRADLEQARGAWIKDAKRQPKEYIRRVQSDFLAAKNHEGEVLDFHALRHTCGAWLSLAGVHPKVVQTVMRHSTITLTMDTYGHLFPGQEADAVARLRGVCNGPPQALKATGTDDATSNSPENAHRQAQQPRSETQQEGAIQCDEPNTTPANKKTPKPNNGVDLGDSMQRKSTPDKNRAGRTRTCNQQIMSLLKNAESTEKIRVCEV
ncbi:tyrosine-type recombinase/integrase [Symmachiella dynata]|uniref:tyrosine-type recombinase/integrase n=1 Tax=Symmachiella dynata TaxID=2527995 RepID=UPI00119F9F4B|nr:site-specific integrase [Symmachiella dynata]